MIEINGLHIELTTICTLKCPRCARTMFIDKFGNKNFKNHNINLYHLKKFLKGVNLQQKIINLCGNYGDPIYYEDLKDVIIFFKQQGAVIHLTTNGSYKTKQWWEEICSLLSEQDVITFSIDGTAENFNQYRINGDWQSIKVGLQTVGQSSVNSVWKFIPFAFNENFINQAQQLSADFGIKQFKIETSDRWEGNRDSLKPIKFIGPRESSMNIYKNGDKNINITPKCYSGFEHYISADGKYLPCCYVHDWRFYYKSDFYKEKTFLISETNMVEVLEKLETFYNNITITKQDYCIFNCPSL